jgi:hypothetical protein
MRTWQGVSVLCGALSLAACAAEHAPDPEIGDAPPATAQALFTDSQRVLSFIGHQDDDIFTMTPDLFNDVVAKRTMRTVVFTAGDAGLCQDYIESRALGQKLAWEVMAGVDYDGDWDDELVEITPDHFVLIETMPSPAHDISIVYLGLSNNELLELEVLWNDLDGNARINTLDARLAGTSYSRPELIELLAAITAEFGPTHVNTLDSSKLWPTIGFPSEHTDHVHGALFSLAALQRVSPQPDTIRLYRTYNAIAEVANVASVDSDRKHSLYEAYAPHDPYLCEGIASEICGQITECQNPAHIVYGMFEPLQYPIPTIKNVTGVIRGPGNRCLKANGTVAGSTLALAACTGTLPVWSLPNDGTLRLGNLCVSAATGVELSPEDLRGSALRLETCNAAAPRQRFALSGAGQLRGPDATCTSSANANQLTLAECADLTNQLGFALNFQSAPFATTNATSFVVTQTQPAYYQSLTYGDLDRDGDSDVCIRRTDGVYCATNNGNNQFTGYSRRTLAFSDGEGYGGDSAGSTLQLADIDNDNDADLCARKSGLIGSGIYCATNTSDNGTTFGNATKRTGGNDFGDWYGYGSSAVYYGSIRFADVNNDKVVDVCGRNSSGIECATNNGSGMFATVSQRTNVEFSDGLGWGIASAGTTIQFADIDGDKLTDVCGRGLDGMLCMLGTGSTVVNQGFERAHIWSDTGDFSNGEGWSSNAKYYGSIRLGDINGDGRADVCGRGGSGVVCGLSTGQAFSMAKPMIPADPFGDASYGNVANATSLALLKLNADSHYDICLRGSLAPAAGTGLRCALAP